MKTTPSKLRAWTRTVHYVLRLMDGTPCHRSTQVVSLTRRDLDKAERKFWSQHAHHITPAR